MTTPKRSHKRKAGTPSHLDETASPSMFPELVVVALGEKPALANYVGESNITAALHLFALTRNYPTLVGTCW